MKYKFKWTYIMFLKWNLKVSRYDRDLFTNYNGYKCQSYTYDRYPWKLIYDYAINRREI